MRLEDIYALLKKIEAGQVSPSEIQEIREELQNKTEKNLLTYVDGKICTYGGEDVTFNEVYNMLMTEPDFVVLVYNDKAYHPNQVDTDTIIFASTYTNAGHIVTYRILFNSDESVTVSEVTAEKLADKVSEITDGNKDDMTKYTSVKAVTGYANSKSEVNARLTNNASKNLLDCSGLVELVSNGITFTPVYDDNGLLKYINIDGTAEEEYNYSISCLNFANKDIPATYIVSGYSDDNYRLYVHGTTLDGTFITSRSRFNVPKKLTYMHYTINVYKGKTVSNLRIYPMIRRADIKDDTYEPYYPTNTDLWQMIKELQSQLLSTQAVNEDV